MSGKLKMNLKLGRYRDIAIMAAALPNYRVLPWSTAKELKALYLDMEGEIDTRIGEQMDAMIKKSQNRIEEIRSKFFEENAGRELAGPDHAELNKLIATDQTLIDLTIEENKLWEQPIEFNESSIEFPDGDYNELFADKKVKVNIMGRQYEVDGYDAFLVLTAKGILKQKD